MNMTQTLDENAIVQLCRGTKLTLKAYLSAVIEDYDAQNEQGLFLPSLVSLSNCFQCSAAEVHITLNEMKEKGCDFLIMDFDTPITLWYPRRLR